MRQSLVAKPVNSGIPTRGLLGVSRAGVVFLRDRISKKSCNHAKPIYCTLSVAVLDALPFDVTIIGKAEPEMPEGI